MRRLHQTPPEKHGRYTFEVEQTGNVKITNTDGRSFYVMGEALLGFMAQQIRIDYCERSDAEILVRL
jgi:hypothetical protein